MNVLDVLPHFGDAGLADPSIVRRGHPEASTLWARMRTLGGDRKPMIGSSVVDAEGDALITAWIDGGP